MTDDQHIFFDIGGVLGRTAGIGSNGRRQSSTSGSTREDFQCRHEEVVGAWEEGRISLDEYLDITVFHQPRKFTREEFDEFMCAQSVPDEA